MTKEEYFKFHEEFCEKMTEIMKAKNSDYTGDNQDPFSNFTIVEANGIATTEQGFLTRMSDKMQRINSFCQKGSLLVEDEKVEDTLMDLANYCILFSGYLRSRQDEGTKPTIRVPAIVRELRPGSFEWQRYIYDLQEDYYRTDARQLATTDGVLHGGR